MSQSQPISELSPSVTASSFSTLLALVLVALNLRPSMASVGTVLGSIQADIDITYTQAALLTFIPVAAMGFASFFGMKMAVELGSRKTISLSILLIGVATGLRFYINDIASLCLSALVAGIGIALVQAVMPMLIKSSLTKNTTLAMGIYMSALMGGAAVSAVLTPWLEQFFGNWQVALAFWAIIAAISLVAWLSDNDGLDLHFSKQTNMPSVTPPYKLMRAWTLSLFFGLGTAGYTCLLAWLPPYYQTFGWGASESGMLLGFLTIMQVISALITPNFTRQSQDRRRVTSIMLLLPIIGFVGLWQAPMEAPLLWCGLLGVGIGGLFPLSIIIVMDHHSDPRRAGGIVAFVQGVGYLIASVSPLIAGIIKDVTQSFAIAWVLLALVFALMLLVTARFNPNHYKKFVD